MSLETPKGVYITRDPQMGTYHVCVWRSTDPLLNGYVIAPVHDERRSWGVFPDDGESIDKREPLYTALNQMSATAHAVSLAEAINTGYDPMTDGEEVPGCTFGMTLAAP